MSVVAKFSPGDFLRYVPAQSHCREGQAFVNEDGVARDLVALETEGVE